jgi:SAM-dependent methyltransferase
MTTLLVARAFDKAAPGYDAVASIQAQVAKTLVMSASVPAPRSVLDIGCGTGSLLSQAGERWPQASLTGLDIAPGMLDEARRKTPGLAIIQADAGECDLVQRFDLIFSCMMLHWFPQPAELLRRWRRWLTPQGTLLVGVPVAGSLGAWGDLCDGVGVRHGLWPFPPPGFASGLASDGAVRRHEKSYGDVLEFLRALKQSGGATPRQDHKPISSSDMRKLVRAAPRPFNVAYHVLYATITAEPTQ